MTVPCLDCKDRSILCHSSCEKYAAYKERMSKQRPYTDLAVKSYWSERKFKRDKAAERCKKHH